MEGLVSSLKEKRGLAKQDESSILRRWSRLFPIGFAETDGEGKRGLRKARSKVRFFTQNG